MTTLLEPGPATGETPRPQRVRLDAGTWVTGGAAALVVLLRLPTVWAPPGPDEAGYLTVASQWHAGGSSLYGNYWVDRPPLLLTIFQVASWVGGGLPALRVIGCAAAVVTVVAVAVTVRQVAGRTAGARAAAVSAVLAAVLLVSPQLGAGRVNGELLAAPFTAVGLALVVTSLRFAGGRRAPWAAAGVGAAAAAAILVKQNMVEVLVFAVVSWALAWRVRTVSGRRLAQLVGAATAGAGLVVASLTLWTVAHGTSPGGVFFAMYPFRVLAGRVLAAGGEAAAGHRLASIALGWAESAVPLLVVAFAWAVVRRTLRGPVVWALAATLAYSVASILMSGSYWSHYLVELVVPVAVATGLLAAAWPVTSILLVVPVAVLGLLGWATAFPGTTASEGTRVGAAVARSAHPGDTIVTAFGNAQVVLASHLSSPYPYLWSLPARTLDPRLRTLGALLAGPHAPTWLVVESPQTRARLHALDGATLRHDYRTAARSCGRTVYLHDGAARARPLLPVVCHARGAGRGAT